MIHAASGEIEYAKSVIRKIKERYPQQQILLSFTSPSAIPLTQNLPEADILIPLPWDSPNEVNKFLNFYKPKAILIARTDLWPQLLLEAKKRNIPSVLFSATLDKTNNKLKFPSKYFYQLCLDLLTEIHLVSEADEESFLFLKTRTPLFVTGDTRYDQVHFRLKNESVDDQDRFWDSHPILCLGSTWPQDEEKLWATTLEWIKMGGKVVWAPHEVELGNISKLQKEANLRGVKSCLYSQIGNVGTSDILIVDRVGVLLKLYSRSKAAFVGGSFRGKVHSVMEPLATGCLVSVGPYYKNNREAIEFSKLNIQNIKAVTVCQSESDLLNWAKAAYTLDCKTEIIQHTQKHMGTTERLLDRVLN